MGENRIFSFGTVKKVKSLKQNHKILLNQNYKKKDFTLTLRVDSDDLVSSLYLTILINASEEISKATSFSHSYFYYPCGLTYNLQENDVSPRIWPESSFMACLERTDGCLKTVWNKPHDTISQTERLYPIVTNKPIWITIIGHGNMVNAAGEYLSDLKDLNYPLISDKL